MDYSHGIAYTPANVKSSLDVPTVQSLEKLNICKFPPIFILFSIHEDGNAE